MPWKTSFAHLSKDTRGKVGTEFHQDRSWKTNKRTTDRNIVLKDTMKTSLHEKCDDDELFLQYG